MKGNLKEMKGVTLIALVITIIVLLILAGVSIAMLTGDNGLLTKAENAKVQTEIAEIKERVKTDILGEQAGNKTANISKSQLKTILDKYFTDVPKDYTLETEITAKAEYGSYKMKVSDFYDGKFEGDFDEDKFTLGTSASDAKNTDKYGYKVPEYTVTTDEFTTGVWRLFYQDTNYTYLITDECVGNYNPSDYYKTMKNGKVLKYQTGADVSVVGQKLSPLISSLFTSTNKKNNIRATAWLTDTSATSMWSIYTNDDAIFAIGAPTVELFVASYNNRNNKSNTIILGLETYGYTYNTERGWFTANDNHRIYNNGSAWWIASPYNSGEGNCNPFLDSSLGNFNWNSVERWRACYSSCSLYTNNCIQQ